MKQNFLFFFAQTKWNITGQKNNARSIYYNTWWHFWLTHIITLCSKFWFPLNIIIAYGNQADYPFLWGKISFPSSVNLLWSLRDIAKNRCLLISPHLMCLWVSPKPKQLISYPSRYMEDKSPHGLTVIDKHFFETVESNKCNSWWWWSLTLQLLRYHPW